MRLTYKGQGWTRLHWRLARRRSVGCGHGGAETGAGFTLVEYLICLFIATFTITTIATGYVLASQRTEFITASAAAQEALNVRLETVRAAQWDLYANPPITGRVENLAGVQNIVLGRLRVGSGVGIPATLTTVVTNISTSPPLLMVRLQCVWSYMSRGPFTNTLVTYRAPDT